MSEIITIQNDALTVSISTYGAELQNVRAADGTELLWNGDPAVWSGRAPILFPIAGGLKEDTYRYNGASYTLEKHGFGRTSEFISEQVNTDSAVFLLRDSEQTRTQYPFAFELRIVYTLEGNTLKVDYLVDNKDDNTMYFSIGAHEGYACPNGIEEYSVIFDEPETLSACDVVGNLIRHTGRPILENERELKLENSQFEIDALVFLNAKSEAVTLLHRPSGRKIRVEFPNFPYLLLWTKPGANYICIEPWCGIPDTVGSSYELVEKEGIILLDAGKQWRVTHKITV